MQRQIRPMHILFHFIAGTVFCGSFCQLQAAILCRDIVLCKAYRCIGMCADQQILMCLIPILCGLNVMLTAFGQRTNAFAPIIVFRLRNSPQGQRSL